MGRASMTKTHDPTTARATRKVACAGLMALTILFASSAAHATVGQERAPSGAKATVGLAMLGAEAVLSVEALVGVKPWWGYAVGGGLGAIAGGVGGYFIDRTDTPTLSMGLLAGGIVFAVPTTLAVLSARAYKPARNPEIDPAQFDGKLIAIGQAIAERHGSAHQLAPTPLLALHAGSASLTDFTRSSRSRLATLALPAASLQNVYSAEEMALLGLNEAVSSVRLPLLNLSF